MMIMVCISKKKEGLFSDEWEREETYLSLDAKR